MNKEKPIVENVVIADSEGERTFVHCPENYEGEYIIPDGVTAIAPLAFKNCSQLESIVIPNSVRHIGHHAFEGCTAIEEIKIPIGINTIEEGTFMGCTNLSSVAIPPTVNRIEKNAFRECSTLDSGIYYYYYEFNLEIKGLSYNILPSSIEIIGDSAFRGCSSLEYITIPFGVTTIGKNAFSDCRRLEEIQVLGIITNVGKDPFSGCKKLESIYTLSIAELHSLLSPQYHSLIKPLDAFEIIDYKDSIADELIDTYSLDGKVFLHCSKYTIKYRIPEGVEEICAKAFAGCKLLKEVSIPKTITRIGYGAFSGCEQIKTILLPESIESIGQNTFYGYKELKEIYIPNGSREKFEKLLPKHLHDKLKELKQ